MPQPDPNHPFLMLVTGFFGQLVSYFAVVGLLFLLVWKVGAKWFRGSKLRPDDITGAQLKSEAAHSVTTLLGGTLSAGAVGLLVASGHSSLSSDASRFSPVEIVGSFFALIVFNDAWFYWCHRLLHHPKLFRYVHAVHHRSVTVNPFTSYSFHLVEAVLLGAWVVPVTTFIPLYLPMIGALQVVGLGNNVMSHLGYEFLPRWLVRVPGLKWVNSATFHQMHHTGFNGNYGLFFRLWDRLCGTALPDYEKTFVERGKA